MAQALGLVTSVVAARAASSTTLTTRTSSVITQPPSRTVEDARSSVNIKDHDGTPPAGALYGIWTPTCYPTSTCWPYGWDEYWYSSVGYYSPGICPSGFSSGCSPWTTDQGPPIEPTETAIQCVKSGYVCNPVDGWRASSAGNWFPMIQVRWAATDLPLLETNPLTPGLVINPALATADGGSPAPSASTNGGAGAANPSTSTNGTASGTLSALASEISSDQAQQTSADAKLEATTEEEKKADIGFESILAAAGGIGTAALVWWKKMRGKFTFLQKTGVAKQVTGGAAAAAAPAAATGAAKPPDAPPPPAAASSAPSAGEALGATAAGVAAGGLLGAAAPVPSKAAESAATAAPPPEAPPPAFREDRAPSYDSGIMKRVSSEKAPIVDNAAAEAQMSRAQQDPTAFWGYLDHLYDRFRNESGRPAPGSGAMPTIPMEMRPIREQSAEDMDPGPSRRDSTAPSLETGNQGINAGKSYIAPWDDTSTKL